MPKYGILSISSCDPRPKDLTFNCRSGDMRGLMETSVERIVRSELTDSMHLDPVGSASSCQLGQVD